MAYAFVNKKFRSFEMKRKVLFVALFVGFVFSIFGQNVSVNEIREYATIKDITKFYARDSSNATWFDGIKNSGNPNVVITRTRGERGVDYATLLDEFRFNTTFYSKAHDVVISIDSTLQFIDIWVADPSDVPYLYDSQYDRRRLVNEPSGSYTLREYAGAFRASDAANTFIKSFENTRAGIY